MKMSQQLESLYPNLLGNSYRESCARDSCEMAGSSPIAYFILWWLILVVIIWFIIYSLQPSWVMKEDCDDNHHHGHHNCQIDQGKAILVSIIIAFILIIIFYLISRSYRWY